MTDNAPPYPDTPDGRYFTVRGRLWRKSDPALTEDRRQELVRQLMKARNDLCLARRRNDAALRLDARRRIQAAKEGLGERGPVWWADGSPDYTRKLAVNTPYRDWYESLAAAV
jgi:hypothetical protein